MTPEQYDQFTQALLRSVTERTEVIGLVALGSMAAQDYAPDAWSDHDFFLVVAPGAQETFRGDLSWLPGAARIALSFRETAHGLKVVHDDGHLLEFAVFDPEELFLARVNRYRVLLDRADVAVRLAEIARRTTAGTPPPDAAWLAGQVLTQLLVAAGRTRRGERLSGRAVLMGALRHLLMLGATALEGPERGLLDGLDPHRRVERVFPDFARVLDDALRRDGLAAIAAVLDVVETSLAPRVPEFSPRALAAIRGALARMR